MRLKSLYRHSTFSIFLLFASHPLAGPFHNTFTTMLFITRSAMSLAAIAALWSPVLGMAVMRRVADPFDGKTPAHTFALMDLTHGVPSWDPELGAFQATNTSSGLVARTPVDICMQSSAALANCISVASFLADVGFNIATLIKSSSNNSDCVGHSGEPQVH